ncbi:MAG TPA: winged helix-turn-helix domain-containing protein [Anaerolineaceae bacterium]
MDLTPENNRDLIILERIAKDPDTTQAGLATQLGVAIGTINWHLKRLIAKGYVKARRVERRKLSYIVTPEGISMRAFMTLDYIQNSFRLYRLVRQRVVEQLEIVRQNGYNRVRLEGDGDVADVCRLTCLEQGVEIVEEKGVPILQVQYLKVIIDWDKGENHHDV